MLTDNSVLVIPRASTCGLLARTFGHWSNFILSVKTRKKSFSWRLFQIFEMKSYFQSRNGLENPIDLRVNFIITNWPPEIPLFLFSFLIYSETLGWHKSFSRWKSDKWAYFSNQRFPTHFLTNSLFSSFLRGHLAVKKITLRLDTLRGPRF